VLGFSGLSAPDGVAVDRAGTVYITEGVDDRVLAFAAGATSQSVLGLPDSSVRPVCPWTAPAPSTSPTPATGWWRWRPNEFRGRLRRIPGAAAFVAALMVSATWVPPAPRRARLAAVRQRVRHVVLESPIPWLTRLRTDRTSGVDLHPY
jgi:hypothetical protein